MAKINSNVVLVFNSEKNHSVRYDAPNKDAALQSVYVKKDAFEGGKPYPQKIQVHVTSDFGE